MTDVKRLKQVAEAYKAAGGVKTAAAAAAALNMPRSTFLGLLDTARRQGLLGDEPGQKSSVATLARDMVAARPKTWWDNLTSEEQAALRQIKKDHLASKHRIRPAEIFQRCKAVIGRLECGQETFKRWLTDGETQDPT